MVIFIPGKDIPDLSGKVVFITGGNSGLGKEAALQLAKHNPANIYIGARSNEKGLAAIADIITVVPNATLTLIQMDLASLSSVKAAANEFLAASSRLDILMNNAGIMAVPPGLSADGYEIQFATNHLGHALLTKLLLPTLLKSAQELGSDVRIITVSSASHLRAPAEGLQLEDIHSANVPGTALARYSRSKVANILYSKELARRYPLIKAVAIHPGIAQTGLDVTMRKKFLLARIIAPIFHLINAVSIEEASLNQLWAATSTEVESGLYYDPVGIESSGSPLSRDMAIAGKLWKWTEDELDNLKYKL